MDEPSLIDALGIERGDVVALVGGGGKTTTMLTLGGEAEARRWPVMLGTTTNVGVAQVPEPGTFLHGGIVGDKFTGVAARDVRSIADGLVVIEADGARGLPAKAPADHEPVIPGATTLLVAVIGADALGRVIADRCHRPLRVAAVVGCRPYERLTPERAATLLTSQRGGRKGSPDRARFAVVVTKVNRSTLDAVNELVNALGEMRVVVVAARPTS
jgi:hypothetical protein